MKKTIPCRLAMFGTALILSALTAFPAFAVSHAGHLDTVSDNVITGWAWDSESPDTAVTVELTISGESAGPTGSSVLTVSATQSREDLGVVLGSTAHGFVYEMDWSKFAAGTYTVTASAVSGETKTPLIGTFTYKKESAPAPAGPASAAQTPSTDSPQTPSGPASQTPSAAPQASNGPASGPASLSTAGLTPEQIALGPGYLMSLSSNNSNKTTARPYGPGAPAYETGEADQYLGTFHATAYCGCESCSGGHALTYSGTIPQPNHTIAADLDLYPLGTKLMIDGIVYTVEDKGSNVVENCIDIFFATHEEALAFGLQNVEVYSVK